MIANEILKSPIKKSKWHVFSEMNELSSTLHDFPYTAVPLNLNLTFRIMVNLSLNIIQFHAINDNVIDTICNQYR